MLFRPLLFFMLTCLPASLIAQGGKWIRINGDTLNSYGHYGIKGKPSIANMPGARWAACTWTDNNNNLWLFGGDLNDLWKYEIILAPICISF